VALAVGVLLDTAGRISFSGDGEVGAPSSDTPQAERNAAIAAAPAPFRNRRRLIESLLFDIRLL
jgi:hypothetical protein